MSKITSLLNSCAAAVALSLAVPPAANAATWSVTSSGTIGSGTDVTGVFGSIGSLVGQTFSQVITLDPTAYNNSMAWPGLGSEYWGTSSGTAAVAVTVNGVTRTFTWDLSQVNNYGNSAVYNSQAAGGAATVFQSQQGYTADGSMLVAEMSLYSTSTAFNLGPNFNQVWSRNVQPGDNVYTDFYLSGSSGGVNFVGTPTYVAINAPVPEPETYAMLLAGLGLLGFTARRRKTLVA